MLVEFSTPNYGGFPSPEALTHPPRGMRLLKAVYSVMCNSILVTATWPFWALLITYIASLKCWESALKSSWIPQVRFIIPHASLMTLMPTIFPTHPLKTGWWMISNHSEAHVPWKALASKSPCTVWMNKHKNKEP